MKHNIKIIIFVVVICHLLFISPVYAYSRTSAIQYADNYAQSPNYMNTFGVGYNFLGWSYDCANFASQIMESGGFAQDSIWKSVVSFSANLPIRTDSVTWKNSNYLKNHLKDYRNATKLSSWSYYGSSSPYVTYQYTNNSSNLTSSNTGKVVMFYDWDGDGTMNHSAFFVADNSSSWCPCESGYYGDLIDQHTSNYDNRKLVLWRPDYRQIAQNSSNVYNTRVYAFQLSV